MKKGILIYDSSTNRFDILYEEGNSYGGLHCGTTMEVLINDEWAPTRICRHRLGRKMLRHRMHERNSLCNRRLWLSLPSPQHHAAPCGSALYIRRIRCMAGPLVPHGLAGDRQCVFLSGACRSIRETWRRFDIGSLGTALGLGKDKGVEIFSEEWGCLRSAPSAGLLRLPRFQ